MGALIASSAQYWGPQDLSGTPRSAIGTPNLAGVNAISQVRPLRDVGQLLMSTYEPWKALGEFMTYRC
jgi:hypothetical protein